MSVYEKVGASATRAVGEFPSSNSLKFQNVVDSQLEMTKTKSCLIALSTKFALSPISLCLSPRTPYILALSTRAWLVRGLMAILELVRGRFGYVFVASG
ncbi:hypothetical protein F2Q70_00016670 [Brassica cretica]|uniref:Uncharacterized protein n=1 Tax=Brassica cretica TaxID=69181 RepID=A0A8S9HZH9_BRACR|nr:hypothetical protein F2Q70_00016670 [Brassica cretica]KAF2599628.1 hypothetical protein F2Q68_00009648 [Brassica cretica]